MTPPSDKKQGYKQVCLCKNVHSHIHSLTHSLTHSFSLYTLILTHLTVFHQSYLLRYTWQLLKPTEATAVTAFGTRDMRTIHRGLNTWLGFWRLTDGLVYRCSYSVNVVLDGHEIVRSLATVCMALTRTLTWGHVGSRWHHVEWRVVWAVTWPYFIQDTVSGESSVQFDSFLQSHWLFIFHFWWMWVTEIPIYLLFIQGPVKFL